MSAEPITGASRENPCPAKQPLYRMDNAVRESMPPVIVEQLPCIHEEGHGGYHTCILTDGTPYTFWNSSFPPDDAYGVHKRGHS